MPTTLRHEERVVFAKSLAGVLSLASYSLDSRPLEALGKALVGTTVTQPSRVLALYDFAFRLAARNLPLGGITACCLHNLSSASRVAEFEPVVAHLSLLSAELDAQSTSGLHTREFLDQCLPYHQDPKRFEHEISNLMPKVYEALGISPDLPALYSPEDLLTIRRALNISFNIFRKESLRPAGREGPCAMFHHLAEVGLLLMASEQPANIVVAGLLHDAYENYAHDVPRNELEALVKREFGEDVHNLVTSVTEPARSPVRGNFMERKTAILSQMTTSSIATVVCASKISTLEAGLNHLDRLKTIRGWSAGSFDENLAVFERYRDHFAQLGIDPGLIAAFDYTVERWKAFGLLHGPLGGSSEFFNPRQMEIPAPRSPGGICGYSPPEETQAHVGSFFDADALLRQHKITFITGGQSGVDRALLDVALKLGHPIDGWCPLGREAEDGVIPPIYPLREAPVREPAWRTSANARDSDVTVILSRGRPNDGTPLTACAALFYGRPHLEFSLDAPADRARFIHFIEQHGALRINIAGPRESFDPGNVYAPAFNILLELLSPKPAYR